MPRKLYRLLKSTPPVTATFGSCAAAGAANTPRKPAHSATDIVALQIARLIQPSTRKRFSGARSARALTSLAPLPENQPLAVPAPRGPQACRQFPTVGAPNLGVRASRRETALSRWRLLAPDR